MRGSIIYKLTPTVTHTPVVRKGTTDGIGYWMSVSSITSRTHRRTSRRQNGCFLQLTEPNFFERKRLKTYGLTDVFTILAKNRKKGQVSTRKYTYHVKEPKLEELQWGWNRTFRRNKPLRRQYVEDPRFTDRYDHRLPKRKNGLCDQNIKTTTRYLHDNK